MRQDMIIEIALESGISSNDLASRLGELQCFANNIEMKILGGDPVGYLIEFVDDFNYISERFCTSLPTGNGWKVRPVYTIADSA